MKGRFESQLSVRVKDGDLKLLEGICASRGEDVSDFVRRAIRTELARLSYLSPEDKKALGVAEAAMSQT